MTTPTPPRPEDVANRIVDDLIAQGYIDSSDDCDELRDHVAFVIAGELGTDAETKTKTKI